MSDDQINPYAAPASEAFAEDDYALAGYNALQGIRRRSVILMLFLCIVTLGLYVNYWVHQTAVAVNKRLERNRLSMGMVALFWGVSLLSTLWIVPEIVSEDAPGVVQVGAMLNWVDTIFSIVMAFTIRAGLHSLLRVHSSHAAWFNGIATFFFGILYLQWKINGNRHLAAVHAYQDKTGETPSFEFLADAESD